MTPLNNVPQSATRLGLPVIQTPASVEVVTERTIQEQGYRTTTDTAQGAVGVLSGTPPAHRPLFPYAASAAVR
jgi:iron complex outermembrane recepter protein